MLAAISGRFSEILGVSWDLSDMSLRLLTLVNRGLIRTSLNAKPSLNIGGALNMLGLFLRISKIEKHLN
jgi:hypothetical protein